MTPLDCFIASLDTLTKAARHLEWSRVRLFAQAIDSVWVEPLTEPLPEF